MHVPSLQLMSAEDTHARRTADPSALWQPCAGSDPQDYKTQRGTLFAFFIENKNPILNFLTFLGHGQSNQLALTAAVLWLSPGCGPNSHATAATVTYGRSQASNTVSSTAYLSVWQDSAIIISELRESAGVSPLYIFMCWGQTNSSGVSASECRVRQLMQPHILLRLQRAVTFSPISTL